MSARPYRFSCRGLWLAAVVSAALPAVAHAAPPANDDFAGAQAVQLPTQVTATNVEATLETGEPATSGEHIGRSVWYRLTLTATKRVRIDTCRSDVHTELAVYTGDSVGDLSEIAQSRYECNSGGRVYLDAVAATTYHIRVAGAVGTTGPIALTIAVPQAPANDDFADAQTLSIPARVNGSNVDATLEPGEPEPSPYGSGHSVWYRLAPTTAAPLRISTCGDGSNSMLAVYTGSGVNSLTEVGRDAGFCGFHAVVDVALAPGATYYVAVRGHGHTADDFTLDVSAAASPPLPALPPPPPMPSCPSQLSAPGSITYHGTHSAGGSVCLTLTADFSRVTWFHVLDAPGDTCTLPFAVARPQPATPIHDRRFSHRTATDLVTGAFATVRGARGTVQLTRGGPAPCRSTLLSWTASTNATPPWAFDRTPPELRLRGPRMQRPLKRNAIVVLVGCSQESCLAAASAKLAGAAIRAAGRTVRPGAVRTLRLVLSPVARRAIRSALRSRPSARTKLTVTGRDLAGNRSTARRTITLRR